MSEEERSAFWREKKEKKLERRKAREIGTEGESQSLETTKVAS